MNYDMKTISKILVLAANMALSCAISAQVFNCGSSGTLGDKVVTTNEVWNIPDNGQFHLKSLVVEEAATLSFRKQTNGLNPPVYLLAQSNVTIHGTISVDGQPGAHGASGGEGGPGGFSGGGYGHSAAGLLPGFGHGPGAIGVGGYFGSVYGNLLLMPLIGGSGGRGADGNPGSSGGGGGGAILIASDIQVTLNGRVSARGGSGVTNVSGGGSGGGVRIVTPRIIGNGTIDIGGYEYGSHSGGSGRFRLDRLPANNFTLNVVGTSGENPLWRIGRNPVIFPANPPQLAILQAAGVDIAEGTNAAVIITLSTGSPPQQDVTLQARNFTGEFTTYIDVTPENGNNIRTSFVWNVGTNKLATTNITVQIPGNTPTRITAWAEVSF